MRNKLTLIIILVICFFIGFSLPYIYENYGSIIEKYVSGNGNEEVEVASNGNDIDNSEEQKEEEPSIDYDKLLKAAEDSFYEGNYEDSIEKYIELYEKGYDKLEVIKNIVVISDYGDLKKDRINDILSKTYNEYQDSVEYNYYYGKYLYENSKKSKAEEIFNRLIVLLNENEIKLSERKTALVYYYLGNIYSEKQEKKAALEFYKKGLKHNDQIILNYMAAAEIYKNDNEYNKAIDMYQKTLAQDHSLSELYYELAVLYENIGKPLKAYDYWERCVNSGIKTEVARDRINKIESEYPKYFLEELEIKGKRKINWVDIVKIEPNNISDEIKIGLQDNLERIRFQSKNNFYIKQNDNILFEGKNNTRYQINYYNNTFYVLKNGDILKIIPTNQKIQITTENSNNLFAIYDIKFAQSYFWGGKENRQYRGDIYLSPVSNRLVNLLNYVDLTSYMLSVVPSEMPASWPSEALKAQSVVARSYILSNLDSHQDKEYDLCANVHCIVYSGANNESKNSTDAILATRNEVITHEGKIIDAVFSSNSGGYTEASENVWSSSLPYLKAFNTSKQADYNFPLAPYQIEEWFIEKPDSYSNNNYTTQSSYRWVKNIDLENLKQRHNLEGVNKVHVTERTKTGTVKEVVIEGINKSVTVKNASIRSGLNGLKSNKFILKNIYNQEGLDNLIVFGAGWGHSVGMDQSAAAGLAVEGKEYKEIINLFYPETKITELE